MSRGETVSGQVCDPIMELVVTRCDKADPLVLKVMAYGENGIGSFTIMGGRSGGSRPYHKKRASRHY